MIFSMMFFFSCSTVTTVMKWKMNVGCKLLNLQLKIRGLLMFLLILKGIFATASATQWSQVPVSKRFTKPPLIWRQCTLSDKWEEFKCIVSLLKKLMSDVRLLVLEFCFLNHILHYHVGFAFICALVKEKGCGFFNQ